MWGSIDKTKLKNSKGVSSELKLGITSEMETWNWRVNETWFWSPVQCIPGFVNVMFVPYLFSSACINDWTDDDI